MSSLDASSGAAMSTDLSVEQLLEEKVALQAQNAQLWRLVDKQRTMIVGLQRDLDRANILLRSERARNKVDALPTEPNIAVPYPTTPKKGGSSSTMPTAPEVIEDYDDVSTTTERSPENSNSPTSLKNRRLRGSPRVLDLDGTRNVGAGETTLGSSPLRPATIHRSNFSDDGREQSPRGDGSSAPMSPALSLRMQQITRTVSPLTQAFPQTSHSVRSPVEEVERVNMPRRERVRTSSTKSVPSVRSLQQESSNSRTVRPDIRQHFSTSADGVSAVQAAQPSGAETDPQFATPPFLIAESVIRVKTPDDMLLPGPTTSGRPSAPLRTKTQMSTSESGNTLADIAGPYYSDSTSFLPLPGDNSQLGSSSAEGGVSKTSSQLARPASTASDYSVSEQERSKTPEQSKTSHMELEPPVDFLPTPAKHIWEEHSPERLRRDSIASSLSGSSLLVQPGADGTVMATPMTVGVLPKDVTNVKVCTINSGSSATVDIAVYRADMLLLHKLHKSQEDLRDLQKHLVFKSGLDISSVEDFQSQLSEHMASPRAAIDAWFQALQLQIDQQHDLHAASIFSSFLSTDYLKDSATQSVAPRRPPSLPEASDSRAGSIGSAQYKDLPVSRSRLYKDGYLKKRGKNFGGWKSRYFVLDGPLMRFYESPGGSLLGTIKIPMAQIGRQQTNPENPGSGEKESDKLQHAFLILEPKKRNTNSFVRHVLCASSDSERDDWINTLLAYVHWDEPSTDAEINYSQGDISKYDVEEKKDSKRPLRLTTPTRGPVRDLSEASPRISSKDAFAAIGYTDTRPGRQPVFDPQNHVIHSPSLRSMESEVPAVSISRPMNGAPIDNNSAWGATSLSSPSMLPPPSSPANTSFDKKPKKKSFWTFGKSNDHNSSTARDTSLVQSPSFDELGFRNQAGSSGVIGVFGVPLLEAVQMSKDRGFHTNIPIVVSRCIDYLDLKHAEQEEGIYRLSGSNTVIRGLKERFNQEIDINLAGGGEYYDIHAIAGLLKLYLRELPSSILTRDLQRDFLDILEVPEGLARTVTVRTLLHSLPKENLELLKVLSRHLGSIVSNSDINKMTLRNVGIVFSPTLNIPAAVFSLFIEEYDSLFEDRDLITRSLSPRPFTDTASIRSTRSNNPTASVILDAEQSYSLLQRDYAAASSENLPYGLSDYRTDRKGQHGTDQIRSLKT